MNDQNTIKIDGPINKTRFQMGKKFLKGKLLLLGTSLLLFGACKAENRETTKLDETFAHFLDEQKNSVTEEAKAEMDVGNIVTSEETAMKKAEPAPVEQKKKRCRQKAQRWIKEQPQRLMLI